MQSLPLCCPSSIDSLSSTVCNANSPLSSKPSSAYAQSVTVYTAEVTNWYYCLKAILTRVSTTVQQIRPLCHNADIGLHGSDMRDTLCGICTYGIAMLEA